MIADIREVADYLHTGERRLAELNALPWRFPGKRGPTKPPAPAPPGIRALAVAVVAFSARVRKRADRELLYRAARGERLRPWERRRVEYLAVRATAHSSQKTEAIDERKI